LDIIKNQNVVFTYFLLSKLTC